MRYYTPETEARRSAVERALNAQRLVAYDRKCRQHIVDTVTSELQALNYPPRRITNARFQALLHYRHKQRPTLAIQYGVASAKGLALFEHRITQPDDVFPTSQTTSPLTSTKPGLLSSCLGNLLH